MKCFSALEVRSLTEVIATLIDITSSMTWLVHAASAGTPNFLLESATPVWHVEQADGNNDGTRVPSHAARESSIPSPSISHFYYST